MNHLKVKDALFVFYKDQGLNPKDIQKHINYYPLGYLKVPFFNLPARKRLIHLHDLNHILFGFDTTLSGEAQLAALELGSGFPKHCRIGYLYSPFALLPGLLVCPIKTIKAFFKGRALKNACHTGWSKSKILESSVLEIRTRLGLQKRGLT